LLDPQKRNVVKNEINILKQLDNEYIMKLYEEIDTPNYLYLVLEYINGIPLIDILRNEKNGYLSQKRATKLMTQIIKGIIYLHDKNIYHRDIKLENILVMKNDSIKIIDFGFAVKCNRDSYQKLFCGTPSYMAPELLNKEKYIPYYSDIWSLGVLFYSMLYGRFPFERNDKYLLEDNDDFFDKITVIELKFYDEIKVDDNIKYLFKKIFVAEPSERITLNEILETIS
jgi:serine/threonine protein kinase